MKFKDFKKYYPPVHIDGLLHYPWEKWFAWQKDLLVAEIVMRTLANKYGGKVSINFRGEWPQRAWEKYKGLKTIRLSITLNEDQETYYLSKFCCVGFLEFLLITKWCRYEKIICNLGRDQINDPDFLINKLEEVFLD